MLNLSNPYTLLAVVLGTIFITLSVIYILIPYLKKNNIPIDEYLDKTENIIHKVDDTFDVVKKIIPIPYVDIIDKIFDYADKSTKYAEQLYKIGQIDKTSRKSIATDYIINILKSLNIEITPDLQRIIDGTIDAFVYELPKTNIGKSVESNDVDINSTTQQIINDFHKDDAVIVQSNVDVTNTDQSQPVNTITPQEALDKINEIIKNIQQIAQ